ncbi:activating signal cointegrator 1 complex subunit 3 [Coemansia biformis]|uniref:Activating signal cointegrator 1 complex subunit 3 n=1 Tax=Coemansia biformis TaxID=1286918 RepID=A0A9W7Y9X5_9FUNG|nr:activating signal cointegrator 1 complex subunit 3 [Coemansia biformis]
MPEFLYRPDLLAYLEELEGSHVSRGDGSSDSAPGCFSQAWLLARCRSIVADPESADALCREVCALLQSDRGDDDIQGPLLELVGYDNMEFLGSLVSQRADIVRGITAESDRARVAALRGGWSLPGVQAVVRTERDLAIGKELSKARRRRKATAAAAGPADCTEGAQGPAQVLGSGTDLRRARERQLTQRTAGALKPESRSAERYPYVFTSGPAAGAGGALLSMFGTKYALPAGTVRNEFEDHEEITIPTARTAPRRDMEQPVEIADMDPLCQYTFRKYTALNRIQSIIYPTAYGSNENILLSAPTGAGKTDVALLTILRTIAQFCTPSPAELDWADKSRKPELTVAKSEFKIVYVAPMKALAAEVVEKYQSRLRWLGISCRELTGDMQLTKAEVSATQIIVTTPEKWDVVTRKGSGDTDLVDQVRLLIVDEIHLLNEDRGSVLEALVARTQRQVESRQKMIRLVGLSATLPNYVDVAAFLGVNLRRGLFYFDGGFRPVPLEQHFVGVHGKAGTPATARLLNRVCYDRVNQLVAEGHQVMVFVHARKDTVATARALRDLAMADGTLEQFTAQTGATKHPALAARVGRARGRELRELYSFGFSIHHAGMPRPDRSLVEELFAAGLVRVLCCTATLAWGVNLPAYAVVIKGTQVYNAQKGAFTDLSILDVLQIFGRAGRPQYESHGVGYILTTHDRLAHYVSAITMQHPIESRFAANMIDNLNAEISLGTVTSVEEGVAWLGYTYMFIRMQKNPLVYGLDGNELADDPMLGRRRGEMVRKAALELSRLQMIVFDPATGFMAPKDLGRIASSYYLRHESVETFNRLMRARMTEADAIALLCQSKEFEQIRARNTETRELAQLLEDACCCDVKGGADSAAGKASILLQAGISRSIIEDFALVSDSMYVAQNAGRIIRALFEIALSRRWGPAAAVALSLSRSIERQMWPFEHPLKQFPVPAPVMRYLEGTAGITVDVERLREMDSGELGALVHNRAYGPTLAAIVHQLPRLELAAEVAPITRSVLQVTMTAVADFEWSDRVHGTAEAFWVWVEDANNTEIYHTENILLRRRDHRAPKVSVFTIPVHDPPPAQIFLRAASDRWVGAETVTAVSLRHLVLPEHHDVHTDLLDLQPLPVAALNNPVLEAICSERFTHFNPVQTQIFHTLYHQNHNALVGAPTGSGKTVAAELAMWRAFREHPRQKVVYIAPLKALVKERMADWGRRMVGPMGRTIVELTGDVTPDVSAIRRADIIVTTPEKWDGVSRSWRARDYVTSVSLVIIDEIHLLGGDRGPVLEVIVSRMNHISAQTGRAVRVVGLSTALANARDLADWLGIRTAGLYNFRHSVRPVPLEMYIDGFPGRHYCPRMASMNRPAYRAIRTHSPRKPVIIFVSSRRQTRLTALDLIAFCGIEDNPRHFLHMDEAEAEAVLERAVDPSLRLSLSFGIGMHHAGLTEGDRRICEQLFHDRKIQVLVATSTLAWGVNLPAHLVILKGTEFYDAKSKGYVDFPLTDVLQMIGRAGRPQFDDSAVARIFVTDAKKDFYKKFLHAPFPVESSLHKHLREHINAEIAGGSITSAQDAVDYLSWTYLYRRLRQNPTYYGVEDTTEGGVNRYLSRLVMDCFGELERAQCVEISYVDGSVAVAPTPLGRVASQYYLSPATMTTFTERLAGIDRSNLFCDLLHLLSEAAEWAELPVRHNEDLLNRELEREVPFPIGRGRVDYLSPHAKTNLLLQKHLVRGRLPCTDYTTDTRTVLDSSIRILQAMVDVAAYLGDTQVALAAMELMQAIKQATMPADSPLLQLPGLSANHAAAVASQAPGLRCLGDLLVLPDSQLRAAFSATGAAGAVDAWCEGIRALPLADVSVGSTASPAGAELAALDHLQPQTQYSLMVTLSYAPKDTAFKLPALIKEPGQAYTPRFGKAQYEGWWLVLAQGEELLAVKRVSMQGRGGPRSTSQPAVSRARLAFITPESPGAHTMRLLVVSDAYLGLDQEVDVNITVGVGEPTAVASDAPEEPQAA